MLFVLTGLLFGTLFRELNKKYGIPYSPLLMVLGIFLGNTHMHLGEWGRAASTMEAIHPHTGMSVFVPTLVFTGGNKCLNLSFGCELLHVQKIAWEHSTLEHSRSHCRLLVARIRVQGHSRLRGQRHELDASHHIRLFIDLHRPRSLSRPAERIRLNLPLRHSPLRRIPNQQRLLHDPLLPAPRRHQRPRHNRPLIHIRLHPTNRWRHLHRSPLRYRSQHLDETYHQGPHAVNCDHDHRVVSVVLLV